MPNIFLIIVKNASLSRILTSLDNVHNCVYSLRVGRERIVVFTPVADRQLRRLPLYVQRIVVDGLRTQLIENDPQETARNKFRLRRPSAHADYELRLENWRVFYRVEEAGERLKVKIALIGEKQGHRLIIEGEEFAL